MNIYIYILIYVILAIYIYNITAKPFCAATCVVPGKDNVATDFCHVEKPETSGAGTFLGGVHCEATGRNGAATGGHLHRSFFPHLMGKKWGKNWEKKLAKNGKNCVIP